MARPPGGARRRAGGGKRAAPAGGGGVVVAVRKGTWMPEEDAVLRQHVLVHGPRNWSFIQSKGLLPRTGKSCRLRWVNKLRPNLKSGCKLSAEEERLVLDLQAEVGNKWAWIANFLPGRTDNDIKNFWSCRQKRLARPMRLPRPGRSSGRKLSTSKAAASSSASQLANNSFPDQAPFDGSSSSTYGQFRAATSPMDTLNSALVPYDQKGFQHLGYGGAFLPALPAPDNKASSSNAAPLLARTDNGVNNFWGTSQGPSGSLLRMSLLGQSGTNCSSTTAADSSLQPQPAMVKNSFPDQAKFEGSSSSTYGQIRAATPSMDTQNSVLFPYDQTGSQHLGYGGAFLPALPTLDNEASSSNAAPLLARTDNSVNNFAGTSQTSDGILHTSLLVQSRTNCSAMTTAASSLQGLPPMRKGRFLEPVPFEGSSFCSQRRTGTAFDDASGSEQVPNDQTAYQHFSLGGTEQPAVRLATDIQASSSEAASSWPPQPQLYQPPWPPHPDFPWLCSEFAAGFEYAYHQELPPFMQSSEMAFPLFGMQHGGVKIEPQNPPNHFDDLPPDLFDSADQLPPMSPSSSRTISDP